jgi:parallel beta-helix repeat protein
MIRKILLTTLLICTFTLAFTLKTQPTRAAPDDIYVPYDYPTIQAAINAATTSDIIHVTGTYHEHITINKSINLVGEGEAIINGDNTGTVINVTANGVTIFNFKILNAGSNWTSRDSGIKLLNLDTCFIIGNWINNSRIGIYTEYASDIRILENTITHSMEGIRLVYSPNNRIEGNTFENDDISVFLDGVESKLNLIKSNTMTGGGQAMHLQYWASNNTIIYNWAINNSYGIMLSQSQNNTIYNNNFITNTNQAWTGSNSYYNKWSIDWPTGGNYWSNHTSTDNFNGQYQNQAGSDGICDTPYTVYGTDMDLYPLMGPINIYEVPLGFITEQVNIISNSTISNFQMNTTQRTMNFTVTGATGKGFCRVDAPNTIVSAAWEYDYTVLVDGEAPLYLRNWTQGSMTYIYFTYQHSEHEVTIIPELQAHLLIALFITATLIAFAAHKRKRLA